VEVTNSLLVAMMFIMILSIGIGNILMALPPLIDRRVGSAVGCVHLSWIVFLLLMHLNLFWQVLLILEIEGWNFAGFLYAVTGPIVLLLATSVLLPDPARSSDDPASQYLEVARPVFTLLCLVMAWLPGMDLLFGDGLQLVSVWNLAALAVFAVLAATSSLRVHAGGAVLAWTLLLSLLAARGLGLAD